MFQVYIVSLGSGTVLDSLIWFPGSSPLGLSIYLVADLKHLELSVKDALLPLDP